MRYVLACFGYGNLGDESIYQGMLNFFGNDLVRVIDYGIRGDQGDLDCLISYMTEHISSDDVLTIGGGFVFHDDACVLLIKELLDQLVGKDVKIEIRGADIAENLSEESRNHLVKIFDRCSCLEFRSKTSMQRARAILGRDSDITFHSDYSFSMRGAYLEVRKLFPFLKSPKRKIGLGLSYKAMGDIESFGKAIINYLEDYEFVFIPHCYHRISTTDRDIDLLTKLESFGIDSIQKIDWNLLTPQLLKGIYYSLDGVITTRLHGFYFAVTYLKPICFSIFDRIEDAITVLGELNPEYDRQMLFPMEAITGDRISNFLENLP